MWLRNVLRQYPVETSHILSVTFVFVFIVKLGDKVFGGEFLDLERRKSCKAQIGENCYLEVSYVHSKATVGRHVLLSYIDIHDETIPDNVVLHGLKQKDGRFVCRIYGVEDNPKETRLFGRELSEIVERLGIAGSDLWDTDDHTLWMAKLYPERFGKIVTLAPATNSSVVPTQLRHLAVASPFLRRALNRTFMKRMVTRVVADPAIITDAVVEAYMRPFTEDHGSGVRSFWMAMSLLSDRRLPRELKDLKADEEI